MGKGYHWNKSKNKWEANITFNGKTIYLGSFKLEQDAANAREKAESQYANEIRSFIKNERKVEDLTGKIFGNLKVIGETGKRGSGAVWLVRNQITDEITEVKTAHLKSRSVNGYSNSKHTASISDNPKTVIKRRITNLINSKGIYYNKNRRKWEAYIGVGKRKRKHLGRFPTEQQAKDARQKAVDEQIKILEKQLEEL